MPSLRVINVTDPINPNHYSIGYEVVGNLSLSHSNRKDVDLSEDEEYLFIGGGEGLTILQVSDESVIGTIEGQRFGAVSRSIEGDLLWLCSSGFNPILYEYDISNIS